jgi:hypothetical protein
MRKKGDHCSVVKVRYFLLSLTSPRGSERPSSQALRPGQPSNAPPGSASATPLVGVCILAELLERTLVLLIGAPEPDAPSTACAVR